MQIDWMLAVIGKEFSVLPSQVARALNSDPEQTDLRVMPLLRYADAYRAYRRADARELKSWKGDPMMKAVQANDAPTRDDLIEAGQVAPEPADAGEPEGVEA